MLILLSVQFWLFGEVYYSDPLTVLCNSISCEEHQHWVPPQRKIVIMCESHACMSLV